MRQIHRVVGVHQHSEHGVLLLFVGVKEFFKGGELLHVPRVGTDLHSAVKAVGKYHFQRTAHVEECRVVPAVGHVPLLRLHATDDAVVARLGKRKPPIHQRGNNHLVVVERGNT